MVLPSIKTTLVDVSDTFKGKCRYFFKNELEQPSGSFKLRGMSKLIEKSTVEAQRDGKKAHIYSSSGGNAGLASAYASRYHKVPCSVILPVTTPQVTIDKLIGLGATVEVHGAHWGEADSYLRNTVVPNSLKDELAVYIHPFDDPVLWDGHGELVDEIAEQIKEHSVKPSQVKGIVLSVGGGGMYNGVCEGLRRNKGFEQVPVLALETFQTPALAEAIKADKVVTLSKIETIVYCLAAPAISATSLENSKTHPTFSRLVDDLEAVRGTVDYYDTVGGLVEPACGVTVAAATKRQDLLDVFGEVNEDDVIIFIICGGAGVSEESVKSLRELLAAKSL